MVWFVTTLHVIICLILIAVILLQAGKGAEIGAVFGGSSQTVFGSRGAATFLSKVTTVCAIGFMVTSLSLVYLNAHEASRTIMTPTAAPATPAPAPTPGSASDTATVPQEQPATPSTAPGAKVPDSSPSSK